MSFFLPLLYFCFANGFLISISKKSFGKCIPITLMITAFSYFFSQAIFKTFKVGFIINLLFAFFFLVIVIVNIKRKKYITILKKNFFSKGFYAFIVIYLLIFIFDFNRTMTMWDEFSHWGLMVKEMFRIDHFYSSFSSTLMVHKDYPPILSLFELFYTNLSGSYQEPYLIRSLHLFGCSLFIPAIFENISSFSKKKVILKSGLMLGCIFFSILLFDQHEIIHTLYTDYTVAILTAYLLFSIVFEENSFCLFHLVQLSVGCSFLLLTKQVSISFYLLILLMFIVNLLINRKELIRTIFLKNRRKHLISMMVFLVIIPLSIWKGWNFYIEKLNITKQFETSDIEVTKLYGILSGKEGEKWQQETAKNYARAIFTKGMMTTKISLSYCQCMILVCLLIYVLGIFYQKYIKKRQVLSILFVFIVGSLGYALLMLLLYIFNFGFEEGHKLASFNRYMPTYILICISFLVMLFTCIDSKKDKGNSSYRSYIFLFCALFLIQNPKLLDKCLPKILKSSQNEFYHHAQIISHKTKNPSKVFIIAQKSEGEYQFYTKYYMKGSRVTNLQYFDFPSEGISNFKQYFNQNIEPYLLKFDYLYLAKIDESFIKNYTFLFSQGNINTQQLYQVKNNHGKIQLQLVE